MSNNHSDWDIFYDSYICFILGFPCYLKLCTISLFNLATVTDQPTTQPTEPTTQIPTDTSTSPTTTPLTGCTGIDCGLGAACLALSNDSGYLCICPDGNVTVNETCSKLILLP